MKLTFLGTSHGIPEPNKRGSCTMLEIENDLYFIDMGVMALFDITTLNKDINNIKAIFLTHMHGDHSNGIFSFIDLANWYYKSCDPDIYIPDFRAKEIFDSWNNITKSINRTLKYHEVFEGEIFDDKNIRVFSQKTQHCSNSYSYLVETNENKIIFSGDLKHPNIDFPHELCKSKIDVAILEAAHFPITEYSEIIKKYNFKRVYFNHFAPRNEPYFQMIVEVFKDVEFEIAYDYMKITL